MFLIFLIIIAVQLLVDGPLYEGLPKAISLSLLASVVMVLFWSIALFPKGVFQLDQIDGVLYFAFESHNLIFKHKSQYLTVLPGANFSIDLQRAGKYNEQYIVTTDDNTLEFKLMPGNDELKKGLLELATKLAKDDHDLQVSRYGMMLDCTNDHQVDFESPRKTSVRKRVRSLINLLFILTLLVIFSHKVIHEIRLSREERQLYTNIEQYL